uniref:Putative secreted protein n=1 Tax=Ixodes ricinus TaxID=34613 RepID=A0A147BB74_IXORI
MLRFWATGLGLGSAISGDAMTSTEPLGSRRRHERSRMLVPVDWPGNLLDRTLGSGNFTCCLAALKDRLDVRDMSCPGVRLGNTTLRAALPAGVPRTSWRTRCLCCTSERPKSVSFTWPVCEMSMLSGFRSLCTMCLLCKYSRASTASAA